MSFFCGTIYDFPHGLSPENMTSHKCPTNAHSFAASLRYTDTQIVRYIKNTFVILVVKSINAKQRVNWMTYRSININYNLLNLCHLVLFFFFYAHFHFKFNSKLEIEFIPIQFICLFVYAMPRGIYLPQSPSLPYLSFPQLPLLSVLSLFSFESRQLSAL